MSFVRSVLVGIAMLLALCTTADAHPLGNFTSNHLTRLTYASGALLIHYVLDDAEIPTFSLLRSLDAAGRPSPPALDRWGRLHAVEVENELSLSVDGTPAALQLVNSTVALRPGAAGLSTLYFTADYRVALPHGATHVAFADATLPGHIGWRDVVVSPASEPTDELRRYPNALIGSPRDVTAVELTLDGTQIARIARHTPAEVADAPAQGRMNDLAAVLARNLSDPLVLLGALLIAAGLGALHALEPGHGKTLLAISLVGARATVSQALILASALTFAHTAGVIAFGIVVLAFARWIVPEQIYPWIALVSGIAVAVLGANALARELRRRRRQRAETRAERHARAAAAAFAALAHDHATMDDEAHARAHAIGGTAPLTFRTAVMAAAAGNLAPCPAALVVLLAAIATHRIGAGLILIVAFSLGLALTLTLLGIAVVQGAAWLTRRPAFDQIARHAPLGTATIMCAIGAWMIGEAVAAQTAGVAPLTVAAAVLAAVATVTLVRTTRPFGHPHLLTQGEPGS